MKFSLALLLFPFAAFADEPRACGFLDANLMAAERRLDELEKLVPKARSAMSENPKGWCAYLHMMEGTLDSLCAQLSRGPCRHAKNGVVYGSERYQERCQALKGKMGSEYRGSCE